MFNPTSRAFNSGLDPCDARYVGNGPNPATRRANCVAAGINPATFDLNFSNFTIPVTIAGNPDLRNEKANSWTVGAIAQPRFIPGLSVAVDWVNIKLNDAIRSLDGTDILNACYDSSNYPNQFCGLFTRGADGQLTTIRQGYYNAASYEMAGLQSTIAYRLPLSRVGLENAGTVGLSVNYFYRDKLQTQVGVGDINHDAGEIGYPRHSGTANLTYEGDTFNVLFQGQYTGKVKFNLDEAPNARNISGLTDWVVFNTTVGVKVTDQFNLRFIVDNVFNATAPSPPRRCRVAPSPISRV
ncbi:hypothetical protein GCM10020258_30190 [Sphingomonas yabuuchiae]